MRIATLVLAALLVGCSTVGLPDKEESLRETTEQVGALIAAQQWAELHRLYPDRYKAKCKVEYYIDMWENIVDRVGMPEGLQLIETAVRIEGGLGYVTMHWQVGDRIFRSRNSDEGPIFQLDNNAWRIYVPAEELADHRPCDVTFGSDIIAIQTTSPLPTDSRPSSPEPAPKN